MVKPRLGALAACILCSTSASAFDINSQLKVNGFATAGVAWLSQDSAGTGTNASGQPVNYGGASYMQNSYGRAGINENINTKFDSVVGIQFDYEINDSVNLVTQLVAKGQNQDSFKIQADWAYIRDELDDNWTVRAGRLGFPGFMYSDSMLVSYSHPWVRPPAEVYANTPVPSVQGADVTYRYNLENNWTLGSQLFVGNGDTSDGRLTLQNMASLYFTANNDNLTLRAGQVRFNLQNNVSLAPLPNLDDTYSDSFTSVGALYDNNHWLFAAEFVQQRVAGWPADFNAGYITVGHYFGKFLPYATWAKVRTLNNSDKILNGIDTRPSSIFDQTTYSVGLRYDPKPGYCLKAQVDRIVDIGQYDGIFRFPTVGATGSTQLPGTNALPAGATLPTLKPTNLFSLTASVAF